MNFNEIINKFISENNGEMLYILRELCAIPAPSGYERARAEYCVEILKRYGADDVYIDSACNVVCAINCNKSNDITVFSAHTDTVFPDTSPLPFYEDRDRIYCPGCADDTAGVAVLLMMCKFFLQYNIMPEHGIMFVFTSCEEGLGNLKGVRKFFDDMKGRISRFISFDTTLDTVCDRCVGSSRYNVEINTVGGHSYGDFGNTNAIHAMSQIVNKIYECEIPQKAGTKTTYNVGTVSGGTSVNAIAQNTQMLCEYRSDDRECLEIMKRQFFDIFESARTNGIDIKVTNVGDRPCGNADTLKMEELKKCVVPIIESVISKKVNFRSYSTDCNIPLSLGVPSLCIGICDYKGMHTREEYLEKQSLQTGLEAALKIAASLTKTIFKDN